MECLVLIVKRAQKELAALAEPTFGRVKDAIGALAETPRPPGSRKMVGRQAWCIRTGEHRVIYEIRDFHDEQKVVTILHIGPRKDVYR